MMMLTQEENSRRQRDWVITFACLVTISASFVALRLFVKLKMVRNFGVDDIASVAASVSYCFSRIIYKAWIEQDNNLGKRHAQSP